MFDGVILNVIHRFYVNVFYTNNHCLFPFHIIYVSKFLSHRISEGACGDDTEVILEIEDDYSSGSRGSWNFHTHQGGRPSNKGDAAKRWRDEETIELIKLWEEHDVLYNNKNVSFHSKEEREKAVRIIQEILRDKNIVATFDQVWDKLTNLKCYYGSQKREIEYKRSKAFKDYESPWKFYTYLGFLDEHLVQRKRRDAYSINQNDPRFKLKKPKVEQDAFQYDSRASVSPSMVHTYSSQNEPPYWSDQKPTTPVTSPQAISSTTSNTATPVENAKSEDATFCELMCKMLNQIPESEEKAMLKIELQQRVIACRYKSP